MSHRVTLPTVTFDLADVSGIYDYGCYIAVELSSADHPADLVLMGADAVAFRASGIECGSLLDDLTRVLRKSPLLTDISLQASGASECMIVGSCIVKTPTTLPVDVAGALAWAWVDVPLVCGDGRSTCALTTNSQHVELMFRMIDRRGGQVQGRIVVTGFSTQPPPTIDSPDSMQEATWKDEDPLA